MCPIDMNTTGRPTVLITGGSKGIGFELAKQFSRHEHDIVLVARNKTDLRIAAEELEKNYGCSVTVFSLDLALDDAPAELFRLVEESGIRVDVLVNNADSGEYGLFALGEPVSQSRMLQLNVMSLTALTRLFLPGMIERGSGRILNLASVVAYFSGGQNWASYVASKHYVLAFTKGLSKELSESGVAVTALCPGPTATDFAGQAGVGGTRVYH
ncbi:MAG: short-chain dehydrogenase [endosymbiont of Seepiophila jonesi]|uniref:Short-chain dehydrogenase n=1 Tax=endosymbiont of Lamellibrachia luymesi TaxID=2200907 RepID=A0A370E0P1_9GAMM|nr:MAG: short-chain dehydrogenase [endosymbiont of Seepiophila jonesi]RDH91467.1 MAG: short-chain dehydrogenase [endosymbiont of Lamellibrachia luymesi]